MCLSGAFKHGKADFEGNMSRSLRCYLDGALREAGSADERQTKQNIKSGRSL